MCVYLSRNVAMFRTVKGECCLNQVVTFSPLYSFSLLMHKVIGSV